MIVGLRPLISETYDSADETVTSAFGQIEGPSPVRTLVIDAIVLSVATIWGASQRKNANSGWRWTGLEWGLLLVVVSASASTIAAGNHRLAFNGAVDWICCAVVGILLAQMPRDRRRIQWALCVIVASGVVQAVECFDQVAYSFPETREMYAQNRDAYWASRGVPLDSDQVRLFEARLNSREAFGFLDHPNIAGAHLLLCLFAAAGLAWVRFRSRGTAGVGHSIVGGMVVLTLGGAAILTGSLGVGGAALLCAGAWIIREKVRIARELPASRLWRWGWIAAVGVTAAVIGHGLFHGGLPTRSLDFRWGYWRGSASMVADHPIFGVGSGNFGRDYLRYKTIDSPEEVKNPHNFLMTAATDWGVVGLVGVIVMLVAGSRAVMGLSPVSGSADDHVRENPPSIRKARVAALAALLAGGIFLPRIGLLGSSDPNYAFVATTIPLLAWLISFCALVIGPVGDGRLLACGLAFALLAFLIQDSISFASFVPATCTTFFAIAGLAVATNRMDRSDDDTRVIKTGFAVAAACLLGTVLIAGVVPVWRSSRALRDGRRSNDPISALADFDRAAELDSWDSTPVYEAARRLSASVAAQSSSISVASARAMLSESIERIEQAIARDPEHVSLHREQMRTYLLRAGFQSDPSDDLASAVLAAGRVIQLYTSDPRAHEALGDCLAGLYRSNHVSSIRDQAVSAYCEALRLDDARPGWETLRRMSGAKREAIERKIIELGAQIDREQSRSPSIDD